MILPVRSKTIRSVFIFTIRTTTELASLVKPLNTTSFIFDW